MANERTRVVDLGGTPEPSEIPTWAEDIVAAEQRRLGTVAAAVVPPLQPSAVQVAGHSIPVTITPPTVNSRAARLQSQFPGWCWRVGCRRGAVYIYAYEHRKKGWFDDGTEYQHVHIRPDGERLTIECHAAAIQSLRPVFEAVLREFPECRYPHIETFPE